MKGIHNNRERDSIIALGCMLNTTQVMKYFAETVLGRWQSLKKKKK